MRGLLVAFEGIDRSGKSTVIEHLTSKLDECGLRWKRMRFPDREKPTGTLLDMQLRGSVSISDERAVHLLFTANRWEAQKELINLLEEGYVLLLDRYVASGVAYSMAKGLPAEWCIAMEQGLVAPDVSILLKVSADVVSRRDGFGSERFEVKDFQEKVAEAYEHYFDDDSLVLCVDASVDSERTFSLVWNSLFPVIDAHFKQSKSPTLCYYNKIR